jgi:hypothetical protein
MFSLKKAIKKYLSSPIKITAFIVVVLLLAGMAVFSLARSRLSARQGSGPEWGKRPGGAEDFGGPPQGTKKPRWNGPIPNPPKGKITYYKGFWGANWVYPEENTGLKLEPEKYGKWGVNIMDLQPGFEINSKGEVRYPLDFPTYEDLDARIGELAEKFYKANVHLAMTVMIHYKEEFVRGAAWGGETAYVPKEKAQSPGYFKNYDAVVVDMAKIAQKYHFEMFSPLGEPENVFLDAKLTSDWSQQILPKIKKYYKGKIYYKGDLHKGEGDKMNFKGYDVLGIVTTPVNFDAPIEETRKTYDSDMERALAWARRDGVPEVVVSEYGYLGNNKMESVARIGVVLEEGNRKLNGVFLTEPIPAVFKTTQGDQIVSEIKKWFLR